MAGATFSRLKNWTTEVLTYQDLNAEIDNILNNLGPAGVDDYSSTVTEMRVTTDPGEVGSESQATSLAGELERLRFTIKEMKGSGAAQWYSSVSTSLTDLNSLIGTSQLSNRVVSGASSTASSAMRFLVPSGTTAAVTLDASPTALVYNINGTAYSITADTTITGLATAPSSNNTAAVSDAFLTAQERSKWAGEDGTVLTMATVGSEITGLVGKIAAFKVVHSGSTEYFIANVKSSTQLTNARRGFFYDSTGAAKPRIAVADGASLTLLKLTWIFATTASALGVVYTNPTYSATQPSSPGTGDYWFDMVNSTWKTFNSTTWVTAHATLIGVCAQETAATVGARAFDVYTNVVNESTIKLDYVSAAQVQARDFFGTAYVRANKVRYETSRPVWDMTLNLDTGLTESASKTYFTYLNEAGKVIISDEKPYKNYGILAGHYHPYETWKALGTFENNAASDIDESTLQTYDYYSDFVAGGSTELTNCFVTAFASTSALTISMKHPHNPAYVGFRDTTATSGAFLRRRIEGVPAVKISAGSSLGLPVGVTQQLFAYLVDGGTAGVGLAASSGWYDEGRRQNVTFEGGSGTADSSQLYATTSYASRGIRTLARIIANQTASGTWAAAPTQVTMAPFIPAGSDGDTYTYNSTATGSAAFTTAGEYGDLFTMVLSPGEWELNGFFNAFNTGSGVTGTPVYFGIGLATGNDATGLSLGTTMGKSTHGTATTANTPITISAMRVNVTVTTTYFGKHRVDASNVSIAAAAFLTARRVWRGV